MPRAPLGHRVPLGSASLSTSGPGDYRPHPHGRRYRNHWRRELSMKTLKAGAALIALVLVLPAAALAHSGSAMVSCTGAEFSYTNFPPGPNTVNYRITVDNATAAEGTFTLNAAGG